MNVVMIFDQIQAGMGTKDDALHPLAGEKIAIGPAVMMEKDLKEVEAQILACLYCGSAFYLQDPEEVTRKFCAMVAKLHPDVVICGPAYDYKNYARMCASVAKAISLTKIPVLAAMAKENTDVIAQYKDDFLIVRMPEKGGVGLHHALRDICILAKQMVDNEIDEDFVKQICF